MFSSLCAAMKSGGNCPYHGRPCQRNLERARPCALPEARL